MRHLITPMDLSVEETMNILDLAERISIGPQLYKHVADGRQLTHHFIKLWVRLFAELIAFYHSSQERFF